MALNTSQRAYFSMDNGLDPISGLSATGTPPTFSAGKIGNCGSFASASSQTIQTGTFAGGSDWTVNFWFSPTTNITQFPLNKDDTGANRVFAIGFDATNVTVTGWTSGGTGKSVGPLAHGMSTGTFYMWTVTWDSTGNMTVYKNNVSVGTVATTGGAKTTAVALTIGSQQGPANFTNGKIDEIGIWDVVLSGADLTSLYNGGSGLGYMFPNISGVTSLTDTEISSDTTTGGPGVRISDTSISSDSETQKYGYSNTSKSSTTWTNQSKS